MMKTSNGLELVAHETEYGVRRASTISLDANISVIASENRHDAELDASIFGGIVVEREVFLSEWAPADVA